MRPEAPRSGESGCEKPSVGIPIHLYVIDSERILGSGKTAYPCPILSPACSSCVMCATVSHSRRMHFLVRTLALQAAPPEALRRIAAREFRKRVQVIPHVGQTGLLGEHQFRSWRTSIFDRTPNHERPRRESFQRATGNQWLSALSRL